MLDPEALRVMVVTSPGFRDRGHAELAGAATHGVATAVQLRAPELDDDALLVLARDLAARCREVGVLFIVNDRLEVAVASGADGAHVGQSDAPQDARSVLGPDRVLGISVATPDDARDAVIFGADYLGVTVWSTATKPEAVPAGLDGLRAIVETTPLPVIGIGGIDAGNAAEVIRVGAEGVAVISAVADAPDPLAATRELRAAVEHAIDEREGS